MNNNILKSNWRSTRPVRWLYLHNRARRQSGFPTFISCQRQDAHVLPKRRQSHQGDKLCDVSMVPLVACWPVFLARGSDTDGEPHYTYREVNIKIIINMYLYSAKSSLGLFIVLHGSTQVTEANFGVKIKMELSWLLKKVSFQLVLKNVQVFAHSKIQG